MRIRRYGPYPKKFLRRSRRIPAQATKARTRIILMGLVKDVMALKREVAELKRKEGRS